MKDGIANKYQITKAVRESYRGPYNPPYVVYGTGRSGTSFVCKILHDHFGVHLGDSFDPPVPGFTPIGSFEDLELRTIVDGFLDGKINFPDYLSAIYFYWRTKAAKHKKWGFKDLGTLLRICYHYMPCLPKLIFTFRDYDLIRQSTVRVRKWQTGFVGDKKQARKIADWRIAQDKNLKAIFPKDMYLPIYFTKDKRTTEDEVIKAIERRWPEIND